MTQARLSEQEVGYTVTTEQLYLQHGGRPADNCCRALPTCRWIKLYTQRLQMSESACVLRQPIPSLDKSWKNAAERILPTKYLCKSSRFGDTAIAEA